MFRPLSAALVTALSLGLVTLQDASSPAVSPGASPVHTGRLVGTILCSDTHRPARGAVVLLFVADDPATTAAVTRTGEDGAYTFHSLAPGEYSIQVVMPGYLSDASAASEGKQAGERPKTAESVSVRDQKTAHLDRTIERGAAVAGRILYDDGTPASQIVIYLQRVGEKDEPDGEQRTVGVELLSIYASQFKPTDDLGNFRISGMPAGEYRIGAVLPATKTSAGDDLSLSPEMNSAIITPGRLYVYNGNTVHKKQSKTVELRPGEETSGVEITIPLSVLHVVQGQAVAADGRIPNRGEITLTDTSDPLVQLASRVEPDGRFRFGNVPNGTYTLKLSRAMIGKDPHGLQMEQNIQAMLMPVALFQEKTQEVIVKDADVTSVSITLMEDSKAMQRLSRDAPDAARSTPQ